MEQAAPGSVTWAAIAALLVYFVAVLGLGLWAGRRQGSEGYLIADRQLGPLASAASICASKTGAGVFLTHIAYVYLYGAAAIWGFVGVTVGYIGFFFFAGRLKQLADAGRFYTLSDYFFSGFGRAPGYASAVSLAVIYMLGLAGQLVGGAKILVLITGASYELGLTVMMGLIILYIVVGGFNAVVRTDALQYTAILVLTAIMGVSLFKASDQGLWQSVDWSFKPSVSVALLFGAAMVPFAAADLWQRVYATRDRDQARRSLLYAMIMYISFGVLLTALGLLVKDMLPGSDPDTALILAFQLFLPAALIGAAGVVVYAALMSSADTNLFTAGSVVVQDLMQRLSPTATQEQLVRRLRWVIFVVGLCALLWAIFLPELVRLGFLYLSMYTSVGIVVLLSILLPNTIRSTALGAGLAFSAVAVLTAFSQFSNQNLIWLAAGSSAGAAVLTEILLRLWPTGWRRQEETLPP